MALGNRDGTAARLPLRLSKRLTVLATLGFSPSRFAGSAASRSTVTLMLKSLIF
jgi:hypothetical protein